MKRKILSLLILVLLVGGCAATSPPLSYLSMERPKNKIVTEKQADFKIDKTRFGILYRDPVPITTYLSEAEIKLGSKVLRNVNVQFQVPFCVVLFCFGTDSISLGGMTVAASQQ